MDDTGARNADRPNVVVIFVDDMGYGDLSVQGSPDIRTPNIDSIAALGVRCTSGYSPAPQCSPSRAGLLTGQYQQRFAHEANPEQSYRDTFGISERMSTFGNYLGAAGYVTGAIGKWDLGNNEWAHPLTRGFDQWYGFLVGARSYGPTNSATLDTRITTGLNDPIVENRYVTDELTVGAVRFIEHNAGAPFALYVAYSAPHEPFEVPARYLERNEHIENLERRVYASMITALDDGVGQILATLAKHDLVDDTLVVFTSDNGAPAAGAYTAGSNGALRGVKGSLYEGGIRVPLLVQWPRSPIRPGSTYDDPVSALDILPTALVASEQPVPAELEGVSLLPYLFGEEQASPHSFLYWRWMGHKAIRAGNWKWVVDANAQQPELFDVSRDVSEQVNLAASQPERVAELTEVWRAWNRRLVAPDWRTDSQLELMMNRYYGEGMGPPQ
jgi:arylsulfatase A-like enzyme